MLFNSIHFLFFFIIVVFIYFLVSPKIRWLILLISNYYFYMSWNPKYILLIVFSTLVDYFVGLKIYKTENEKKRKYFLYISLITNLGLLFIFKYFNFVSQEITDFLSQFSLQYSPLMLNVILPVGISFYTFQTLSYTIDIYNRKIKPEKHFGIFAVYVSFFPQLVAGPIERAKNLLPQFRKKYNFSYKNLIKGLKIMLWGFFLKLVIADRCAIVVNQIYNNVNDYTGIPLILATYLFAFQIFGDFAGYSLIAIGSAKILGYDLMENFRRPYFAKSISEFWRRWHISLSTWFKDYLYIPLGGNRVKLSKLYFNLFIVFLVSGIWHGAAWTFIVWGVLHGIYLILSLMISKLIKKLNFKKIKINLSPIKIFITFHLVIFGWIFFRANSINDAYYIIKNMFVNINLNFGGTFIGIDWIGLLIILFSLGILFLVDLLKEMKENKILNIELPFSIKYMLNLLLLLYIILFGIFIDMQFIYFQF